MDNLIGKGKIVFYVSYKNFGYNFGRVRLSLLINKKISYPFVKRLDSEILINNEIKNTFSDDELLDIQSLLIGSDSSVVRIADSQNRLLSVDRHHLTQPGAQYLGNKLILSGHPLIELLTEIK